MWGPVLYSAKTAVRPWNILESICKARKIRESDCKLSGLQHHTDFSSFLLRLHLGALGHFKRAAWRQVRGGNFTSFPVFRLEKFQTSEKLAFLPFHERSETTSWNTCISVSDLIMPRIFRKEQKYIIPYSMLDFLKSPPSDGTILIISIIIKKLPWITG